MIQKIYSYEEVYNSTLEYFNGDELATKVFINKYALRNKEQELLEKSPDDMHWRIANEIARIEKDKFKNPMNAEDIFEYLKGFKRLIPQGSPMNGIGNRFQYTSLSNCYVIEPPVDSYGGIHLSDEQLTQISKRRGGTGLDISNLRPDGTPTSNAAKTSTGIIPFMERFSNSIREVGQCLYSSSMILLSRGLTRIDRVNIGDSVWTENGWANVEKVVKNKKDTIKIKTKRGFEIICSRNHFLHTSEGEKKAIDFSHGDSITAIAGQEWYGEEINLVVGYKKSNYNNSNRLNENVKEPHVLTAELAYLIGYSYGDGYVGKHRHNKSNCSLELACSNQYPEIIKKLQSIFKNEYNLDVKESDRSNRGDMVSLRVSSRMLLNHLEQNNILKEHAGCLKLPECLFKAKSEVVFGFIAGYFDADGTAIESKKVYRFASIDNQFLKDIQKILLAYGIVSTIYIQDRSNMGWHNISALSINGRRNQEKFSELCNQSVKVNHARWVPKVRDFTRTIYNTSDYTTRASRHGYIIDDRQKISYSTSERLCSDLQIRDSYCLIEDQIESVDEFELNSDVYDLCLDHTHFFSANGIYVHNSGRRGALMISISIHHPEVSEFAKIKRDKKKVTGANISVRLSDEFLKAVEENKEYEQRWPVDSKEPVVSKMVNAREIWMQFIESAWDCAEPGLLFWDSIIRESPADCYPGFQTVGTNPCGEIPLSALDSCRLLVINIFNYVKNAFTNKAEFDYDALRKDAIIAQRFMDDIIDLELEAIGKIINKIKRDPEEDRIKRVELEMWQNIKKACQNGRRTGVGTTAVGDTIAALGFKYGSTRSIEVVDEIYRTIKLGCYRSSVDMAKELGAFPVWDFELEKNNPYLLRIKDDDQELWDDNKKYGRRNISNTTLAPSGSVSLLSRTTNGTEPVFKLSYKRRRKINPDEQNTRVDFVDASGDQWEEFIVYHPKVKNWMKITGETDIEKSPWFGCCAGELDWKKRVKLQATIQKHIDHSISSTVNLPKEATVEDVAKIYEEAWKLGCKGITIYREGSRAGVLVDENESEIIVKTSALKRPKKLPCDVHHLTIKGNQYFVLVGLLNGEPYEVFADKNGVVSRSIKKGEIIKVKRGQYKAIFDNEFELDNLTEHLDDMEDTITRLVSSNLRHGTDIKFLVQQLEKSKGDVLSFEKAIARALKKYIKDGTIVTGEVCESCKGTNLARQNGCVTCMDCGWSKCS